VRAHITQMRDQYKPALEHRGGNSRGETQMRTIISTGENAAWDYFEGEVIDVPSEQTLGVGGGTS